MCLHRLVRDREKQIKYEPMQIATFIEVTPGLNVHVLDTKTQRKQAKHVHHYGGP